MDHPIVPTPAMRAERPSDRAEGLRQAQRPHDRPLIDLNRASARSLAEIEGLGHVRAAQIVAYRDRNGPFPSLDELACLPHFDRELMERLRGRVKV